jgi:hypothetical protein
MTTTNQQEKLMKTKTYQVKKHLIEKGSINSWTAINEYKATRLSAIIFVLRKRGMDIVSKPMTSKDVNNEFCHFVNYILIN